MCLLFILLLSIFAHWLVRPYRDTSCNIMVVLFCICDLLGVISNPLPSKTVVISNSTLTNRTDSATATATAMYDEEKRSATMIQIVFLIAICITTLSAIFLAVSAALNMIRASSKKRKVEALRKQIEAELFADGEEKQKLEDMADKKRDQFTMLEKILIFPVWIIVYLIKSTVTVANDATSRLKMKKDIQRKMKRKKMGQRSSIAQSFYLAEAKTHVIAHYLEIMLLYPVRKILIGWIFMLNSMEHSVCCRACCKKDLSHHGGYHEQYNHLMEEGPLGHAMQRIQFTLPFKKLDFFQMNWNTNYICPKSFPEKGTLCCQITSVVTEGKAYLAGICVGDIIIGVRSSRFAHVLKPGSDATKHANSMLKEASIPITLTILRETDPDAVLRWEIQQGIKKKTSFSAFKSRCVTVESGGAV